MKVETQSDRRLNLQLLMLIALIMFGAGILVLLQPKDSYFNLSAKPRLGKGVPAPDFTLPGRDGKMISLADCKNKVIFPIGIRKTSLFYSG